MRWRGRRESENVEDRRRVAPVAVAGGGLGTIIIVIIALLLGADPRRLLQQVQVPAPANAPADGPPDDPAQDERKRFISVVLADTEDVWNDLFQREGRTYQEPTLVLFTGGVRSACGMASSAVGPFYCPLDKDVYLDLSFFEELDQRFGAPGDFAQAYVVAHEVGHHVQNLLGISDDVRGLQARAGETERNDLSVRLELQADFLAGVWAHHAQRTKDILEPGDVEEALGAATAIGDDRLQKQSQGYVVPDSFTHGSSAQRVRWFRRGLQTGDMRAGDTFTADDL